MNSKWQIANGEWWAVFPEGALRARTWSIPPCPTAGGRSEQSEPHT